MSNRCLVCGLKTDGKKEYHSLCSKKIFGTPEPPCLDISLDKIKKYAAESVLNRVTVTGVQKKISLNVEQCGKESRFTIVGLWGNYILKPPSEQYLFLSENEHTVMRLASLFGIPTAPAALIRLSSGEPAFITRRFDRKKNGEKIAMEDFCQITDRLTEDKYKGSVERVGKFLRNYSVYPGLDAVDLFERVIFNYLCGNSDMHLKNYSLLETGNGMRLSPAYDLLSTTLVIPEDDEESALAIHGKKAKLKREDFDELAKGLHINQAACINVYKKVKDSIEKIKEEIRHGFMPEDLKTRLISLILKRCEKFCSIRK